VGNPQVYSTEEFNSPKQEFDSEIPFMLWLVPCDHLGTNETISELPDNHYDQLFPHSQVFLVFSIAINTTSLNEMETMDKAKC